MLLGCIYENQVAMILLDSIIVYSTEHNDNGVFSVALGHCIYLVEFSMKICIQSIFCAADKHEILESIDSKSLGWNVWPKFLEISICFSYFFEKWHFCPRFDERLKVMHRDFIVVCFYLRHSSVL